MEAETAGVACRRDELAADGVHLGERADHTCIAEVIGELAAGEAWAGSRLDRNHLVISLSTKHLADEWGCETSEV